MVRGFYLFEETLQFFEAQDPYVEWCMKAAAAVWNATHCQPVIYEKNERATAQTSLHRIFKRVFIDRTESGKEQEPVHQRQA